MIKIINGDCLRGMETMGEQSVDVVLTSPPYNTNKKAGKSGTLASVKSGKHYSHIRYDEYVDTKTNEEYVGFTCDLFNAFDRILKKDGCVLYNINDGANNTDCLILTLYGIITKTPFALADIVSWNKASAIPNNVSHNRLTRMFEPVFVFARRSELMTFKANKKVVSVRPNGQKMYENITNILHARNNDGPCALNKATYSTELCRKLLGIYLPSDACAGECVCGCGGGGRCVFDPFSGSGTTANACKELGVDFIGCELSAKQCEFAKKRVEDLMTEVEIVRLEKKEDAK